MSLSRAALQTFHGGAKEGRYSGTCDEQLLSPVESHLHQSMTVVMPHSVDNTWKVYYWNAVDGV